MPPRCKPPVGEGANLTLTCLVIDGKDKFPQIFSPKSKKNRPVKKTVDS